ncbi:MAG: RHS repeat protein, partial [Clostridiales bacterium]|nr:RHS repeat protein [Clostridiales bacterium]
MKKALKIGVKGLSVLLAMLFVVQMLPMSVFEENLAESNSQTQEAGGAESAQVRKDGTQAVILAEDTQKREEYVKHFRMSDGSVKAVQYPIPVHFEQNGVWTDYDNTLSETDADAEENQGKLIKNKDLVNQTADYSVRLSKKTNGKKFVRFEKDGYKISWYYLDAEKVAAAVADSADNSDKTTLEKICSVVRYAGVYDSTDFEYILDSRGLKENILLLDPEAPREFVAEYKAQGLAPVSVDDKTVELRNAEGTAVYMISAPFMIDANGETSSGITLSIVSVKNDTFRLKLTLDAAWLESETRAYPVTADPYLQTEQNSNNIFTRYYTENTPDSANGTLYVGNQKGMMGKIRSAVKFTLPVLDKSDLILNAAFYLAQYAYSHVGVPSNTINVYEIKEAWSSSNSVPGVSGPPPQYENDRVRDYSFSSSSATGTFIDWDITATAQKWYDGSLVNNGLLIKADNEENWAISSFCSPQNTAYTSSAKPIIIIQYINTKGLNPYHDYTSAASCYRSAIDVNNFSGNLVYSYSTALDTGNRTGFNLVQYYNSADYSISDVVGADFGVTGKSYYGRGFRCNFNQRLTAETINDINYLVHTDADGTVNYFKPAQSFTDKWVNEYDEKTEIVNEPGVKTIKYDDGSRVSFHWSSGRIHQIIDGSGNTLTFNYNISAYNVSPVSATDCAGRTFYFGYNSSHYLTSVTDVNGRITTYSYQNGYLTTITDPSGNDTNLYYDSMGRLSGVGNPQEISYTISYIQADGRNPKVESVREFHTDTNQTPMQRIYGNSLS